MKSTQTRPMQCRTVWISDVHLGSRFSRAEFLLDFLNTVQCEQIYLVGDIIDLWAMRRGVYWPQAHNDVIRALLKKSHSGTRVVYIPGNHDGLLRDHIGVALGAVVIEREIIHTTADGRRLLVMHGDEFDSVVQCGRLTNLVGSGAYDFLIWLNRNVNALRARMGLPYWSLASYLKQRVKSASRFIARFEGAVAAEARHRNVDGLVCGHVHRPEIRSLDGIMYCNTGDWVESCTALVETADGAMKLIHWADRKETLKVMDRFMTEVQKVA